MSDQREVFVLSRRAPSFEARRCFLDVAAFVAARLPHAELEHVGSTAVPGCLTKGDVDVLVRVSRGDFPQSQIVLDDLLVRSARNERTGDYAEYEYSNDGLAASVQLCEAGGWHDRHFHGLKAILESDPEALRKYNALKSRFDGHAMAEYRLAKAELIESLLAAWDAGNTRGVHSALRPGIHG